ncbi:hypothetical protein L6452_17572 [Arctium lappa]|uniref:Uncharacterized protein n=1 Tax=Arctium lappa TaxID=4217 RepID=A0ACB9C3M2_ARCLA|nr:hypothetical protein L6452_17572 [Arctium lappa]
MDTILKVQIHDKLKPGIGYNTTPPPYNNNYIPPKSDLLETKDRKDLHEGATKIDPLDEVVVEDKTEKEAGKSKDNTVERNHAAKKPVKSKSHMKKKTVKESVKMWVPKSTKTVSTATINSATDKDSAARSNTVAINVSAAESISTSKTNIVSTSSYVNTANSVSASNKGNQQLKGKSIWHVDSGCSRHMTGNMACLKIFKKIDGGNVAFVKIQPVKCITGKQHKTSHKSKELNTISSSIQLLHMDLFGPTNVMSIGKKSY